MTGDRMPEPTMRKLQAAVDVRRDLVVRAAERLEAWAELTANPMQDFRKSIRSAASAAAELAGRVRPPYWAVQAAAALLGEQCPPPTVAEARLLAAAEVLQNSVDDPNVRRLAASAWRLPDLEDGNG